MYTGLCHLIDHVTVVKTFQDFPLHLESKCLTMTQKTLASLATLSHPLFSLEANPSGFRSVARTSSVVSLFRGCFLRLLTHSEMLQIPSLTPTKSNSAFFPSVT